MSRLLLTHTALIVMRSYLQHISYVVGKSYAHAFARTLKLIDNQPHLFWVAAGYMQVYNGEGHVISHHSKCFSSTCASMHMVVHSFIHSYFKVITSSP